MPRLHTYSMDIVPSGERSGAMVPTDQITTNGADLTPNSPPDGASPATQRPVTSRRTSRTRKADMAAPVVSTPSAPLTRPDGTPAPVVHLVPELSPYARTGGLGEAVSSLAKHQAASGIPVTVFMPLYGVIRD